MGHGAPWEPGRLGVLSGTVLGPGGHCPLTTQAPVAGLPNSTEHTQRWTASHHREWTQAQHTQPYVLPESCFPEHHNGLLELGSHAVIQLVLSQNSQGAGLNCAPSTRQGMGRNKAYTFCSKLTTMAGDLGPTCLYPFPMDS